MSGLSPGVPTSFNVEIEMEDSAALLDKSFAKMTQVCDACFLFASSLELIQGGLALLACGIVLVFEPLLPLYTRCLSFGPIGQILLRL